MNSVRVDVMTPYCRETLEVRARAPASVRTQTVAVQHILVADAICVLDADNGYEPGHVEHWLRWRDWRAEEPHARRRRNALLHEINQAGRAPRRE